MFFLGNAVQIKMSNSKKIIILKKSTLFTIRPYNLSMKQTFWNMNHILSMDIHFMAQILDRTLYISYTYIHYCIMGKNKMHQNNHGSTLIGIRKIGNFTHVYMY